MGRVGFRKCLTIREVGMGILDIFHIQVLAFIILEYLSTCKKKGSEINTQLKISVDISVYLPFCTA